MSKLIKGVNDLATVKPDLVKEWHPTKNGDLKPTDVMCGSNKKVWWLGKCGHTYESVIANRAKGVNCAICANLKTLQGYNDLLTKNPELAKQWHPTRNGDLKPTEITYKSGKKVWWLCKGCGLSFQHAPGTFKIHEGYCKKCVNKFGSESYVRTLIKNNGSLEDNNPELAKQWHPTKNGELKPVDVTCGSGEKVWWLGECGHEWQAIIRDRSRGRGCPLCSASKQTSFPEQVIIYYMSKLFSDVITRDKQTLSGVELDVYIPSKSIAIEYDGLLWHENKYDNDVKKNELCKQAGITLIRVREQGLPILPNCSNVKVIMRENNNTDSALVDVLKELFCLLHMECDVDLIRDRADIYNKYIEYDIGQSLAAENFELAKEWHPTMNGKLLPYNVSIGSGKKVWWLCLKGHSYQAVIAQRNNGQGCPYCTNKKVLKGYNDLATVNPEFVKEWHPIKNGDLKPTDVTYGSGKKVWWKCSKGHEWQAVISTRTGKYKCGCPYCAGRVVLKGFNDLATFRPDLAKEWHPTKNGDLKPTEVTCGSGKKVWWIDKFGHEWKALISNRVGHNRGCPVCSGRVALAGYNDLATMCSNLASEWHPTKNSMLQPSDVTCGSDKLVWWKCKYGHEFRAKINSRYRSGNINGCPICREEGLK